MATTLCAIWTGGGAYYDGLYLVYSDGLLLVCVAALWQLHYVQFDLAPNPLRQQVRPT